MKKYILHPATFKLDGGAMFGIIPKPLWEKKIPADEFNRILMSLRVILLIDGDKKILIDTGIGDYHSEKFNQQFEVKGSDSPLQTILEKELNISADEITDIILTHLHFDHVGGLGGTDDEVIFKNATIHVHKKHYEYALSPTVRDQGSFHTHFFKPLLDYYQTKNRIHFLEKDEDEILPGINYKTSWGHTPYMIHPIFDGYIYMADLVPMSHHINIPWVMGYDIEPGTTTKYKEAFYKHIMDNNLKMIFEHEIEYFASDLILDEKKRFNFSKRFEATKGTYMEID